MEDKRSIVEDEVPSEAVNKESESTKEPEPKTPKGGLKKLMKFCRPWLGLIILAIVFASIAALLRLFGADLLGDMADYIIAMMHLGADTHDSVVRLGIILTLMYVGMFVLSYANEFIMASVAQVVSKRLRRKLSKKINNLPLSYHDKHPVGDVLSRITNDATTLATALDFGLSTIIAAVTMVIGSIVFMFISNWMLALVVIGASLIGFVFMGLIMAKSQKFYDAQQKELGDVNTHIEEYYGGHTVMKVSNAGGVAMGKFDELNNKLYTSTWKSQFYGGLIIPIMGFVASLGTLAVFIVGSIFVANGTLADFGVIISFMVFARLFTWPLSDIAQAAQNLMSASAASSRVFEFLGQDEMEDENSITATTDNVKGAVKFDNVVFEYEEGKPVIKGFNADIPAGSKVAIVGPTGAGKTTLVNLLMKFYKASSGDITIDGVSINDLRRGNVADMFGMVLQDTWLFEGTVRQNLLYNMKVDPEREQEILDSATTAAGINHFIKTLPNGYDTVLNESANVSAGQKQLLTIVRSMIKDAPLLILDEATSSVDTRTEVLIQDAMDSLTKGRTSFVIAHRLSTIKNADIILVMNHGDIIEKGRHEELLKSGGFYAELYNSQFSEE
ncbi:MAG: ABC transporter ATP-binding protein/permease [Firmicutes bacterium]|nr:ABC transporter ATP-binding protein/permease [Bacillota bacterium]